MKKNIKAFLHNKIHNRRFKNAAIGQSKEEERAAAGLPELTESEKIEIKKKWGKFIKDIELGYPGFQVYKSLYGFDVNYLPFSYFFPWMLRVLNPIEYSHVFSNKGLTSNIFPNIKQPELVAKKINGCILNSKNKLIAENELAKELSSNGYNMIIKKSTDSCCGRNIAIIKANTDINEISKLLKAFEGDYIIQKIVKQSHETSLFNSSSLNTMRISTMLLNGKFSLCTAMIRFGLPNSVVDNVGAGGCCVGINDDGSFMDFGFNNKFEKIESWNGVPFAGHKINNFSKIIDFAEKAHYNIPQCQFAGWDIAIDEKGEPVLIEVNLVWPGLFFEQLANGKPALRGREDELLHFLSNQSIPYGSAI